jgi:tRNA nucleotidyltransferase (CCA-adding enzyme)
MAKAGHAYPQVEPGVTGIMESRVTVCPPGTTVARAHARARASRARIVVTGPRHAVRDSELARAVEWGLGGRPVRDVAWRGLPSLPPAASEIDARRLVLAGAPLVVIRGAGRAVGVVDGDRLALVYPEPPVLPRLERVPGRPGEARHWLLRVAGKVGESMGVPAYAVGGFVRDLLRGAIAPDIDLVVEGDGVAFARRLVDEIGGTLVVHGAFGTASIEGGRAPAGDGVDGVTLGRVDVASARRERYRAAGALPEVGPATVLEDLRRRDFSVNAMAIALGPERFGHLLDPLGGRRDLRRRRLRALRPLAFVEDPTRVFRAARYAARLDLRPDAMTLAGIRLAVDRASDAAPSGPRLWHEIELAAAEPCARRAFEYLVRWRAVKILNIGRISARYLRSAESLTRWARAAGVAVDPAELFLVALLIGRPAAGTRACLDRLALTGEPRARIEAALVPSSLPRQLEARRLRPSEVDERLRPVPEPALLSAWLRAGARGQGRIQWYLAQGRAVRPRLGGLDVVALGVPRGPEVGRVLAILRRARLDGALGSLAEERELVKEWLTSGKEA